MVLSQEEIKAKLKDLEWQDLMGDGLCWKWGINRYVDIDLPYIDVYCYDGETESKVCGYLTSEELELFNALVESMRYY